MVHQIEERNKRQQRLESAAMAVNTLKVHFCSVKVHWTKKKYKQRFSLQKSNQFV
jgi:hypothetical protein